MIKKYNEFKLNNEINFLFINTNESINSFIFKLKSLLPKLKSIIDIKKFIPTFLNYLKNKSYSFKKVSISSFLLGIFTLSSHPIGIVTKIMDDKLVMYGEEMKEAIEYAKKDVMFKEYSKEADMYLSRDVFNGTPLTGDLLAFGARKAYEKYGVLVPLELALSQAQHESSMGTKGLSSKNNPFNVGEFDNGTYIKFNSTKDGVDAYFNLIASDYLKNKNVNELLSKNGFVNYLGKRYASATNYESNIKDQMIFIRNWINKNKQLLRV